MAPAAKQRAYGKIGVKKVTARAPITAKIGSTPDVTLATIAPLPVGATVVKVQFLIP